MTGPQINNQFRYEASRPLTIFEKRFDSFQQNV
jgi:hypothetical protein